MAFSDKDTISMVGNDEDPSIGIGRYYAHPPPGEEVCITGISGTFSNSLNVSQLKENLFNKIDMVSDDERRWNHFHFDIPRRSGKIYDVDKFDPGFFGVHYNHVESMDPMQRLLLEKGIECIFDAGIHPSELEGTKTGVFIGAFFEESEEKLLYHGVKSRKSHILGNLRSMMAHNISHFLKLKGPSYIADSACSSSLHALENGYKSIRDGVCDMAIVGGSNLSLHPAVTVHFKSLGVLSPDGTCKSFDERGDGYGRAEAVSCVLLQKTKFSRRIYAKIVHIKTNCDGFKDLGISYPSREMQMRLMKETYVECQVDPSKVCYVEAHGTGTKVGDLVEAEAIDEVFCKNRDGPLLIGAVKSNLGHSEGASGLTSVIKCLIAMEEGYIPPNIHHNTTRKAIRSFKEGRMKVVVEKTPLPYNNGLVAISNFGFGGANSHVLLEWNHKVKVNEGKPIDDIPRLVYASGRTPEAISSLLDPISEKFDAEYIQLLHEIFNIHQILISKGANISDIIQNSTTSTAYSVVDNVLGTICLQIGIIELLKNLKVEPNSIFGLATGEISCAYFDGFLTLQQAVVAAFEISDYLKDISRASSIYLVKSFEEDDLRNLPTNVKITWRSCDKAAAISGEAKAVHRFVTELQKKGVEAIKINVNDQSQNIAKLESDILQKLRTIIPDRKSRSSLWLSTTGESIFSAEYLAKSLHSKINTENIAATFSNDTVLLEIGLGRLSTLMNHARNKPLEVISFNEDQNTNGLVEFLKILGNIFEIGFNPQVQNLYPKVQYPISRGTPMISDKIKWEHSKSWHVLRYSDHKLNEYREKTISVFPKEDAWLYIRGHDIDGRNLFPTSAYINMVWEIFAAIKRTGKMDMAVVIENCRFHRAVITKERIDFTVQIQKNSGNFEVIEDSVNIVDGNISLASIEEIGKLSLPLPPDDRRKNGFSMDADDIYKELHLRGYFYKDEFRLIQKCNLNATKAYIRWTGNWVTFMDNMLQFKLLQYDTRTLYVPIALKRITIDAEKHLEYVRSFGESPILPVYNFKDAGIIRCGGIEIKGLSVSSIARRKLKEEPILERYEFVPNECSTSLLESLRIITQIAAENVQIFKFNVTEVIDDATREDAEPLGPLIFDVSSDQPYIQPNVTILSKKNMEIENVTVKRNQTLANENNCLLIVGSNILERPTVLNQAFKALKENGFILSREELDFDPVSVGKANVSGIDIITIHTTEKERLIFFRKSTPSKEPIIVEISDTDEYLNWLSILKKALETINNKVIMYAQNQEHNGLLGLYNCVRKEAVGTNLQCFLIYGRDTPSFDVKHPFYQKQVDKNISVNIYKDGKWGTYRHLSMKETEEVESEHCFVNQNVREDLSSLKLVQGPLNSKSEIPSSKTLIYVYYASINFKDVLIASGRLSGDVITMSRFKQNYGQAFDFAGRDSSGRRVMGVTASALSTLLLADRNLILEIPESWTMEEAVTVPVVYGTVLYALFERGKIREGESILIHSGTGGVGQAAIHVALALGCNIFTTVGSLKKREFLKKLFPQLKDCQIGNSRELTFQGMVKKMTKGRGVDLVLNSLEDEKLIASIRCLAKGGRFLEIGGFDIANDNRLALLLLEKECSFHGIIADQFFTGCAQIKYIFMSLIKKGIETGTVKPLTTNVFPTTDIEDAYRFMSSGKHTGKVLIRIRKEELQKNRHVPSAIRMKGLARFSCNPAKSYVILGGLGGFGLELANWLVLRGAKKLILSSRTGVKTGYQSSNIKIWISYGVIVKVSTNDITTKDGCEKLIIEAENLGPVDGVFNLATVLKDSVLKNQTPELFRIVTAPKICATKYLDEITRELCSQLRYFVLFSSISCGRGNAGQSNYGMANSAMEKICEQRRKVGYPALAIQWGVVGDVGILAQMKINLHEFQLAGSYQQTISSCLKVMDTFLSQTQATIVSSTMVGDKKHGTTSNNIVNVTANKLGIKVNTVSPHVAIAELGMDSLTTFEMKQTLEKEFELFLSPQEIRSLTFARLQEIQHAMDTLKEQKINISNHKLTGLDHFVQDIADESIAFIPIVRLPSLVEDQPDAPFVFLFPGIEGNVELLRPLAAQLNAKVIGLQCCFKLPPSNFITTAEECLMEMNSYLKLNNSVNIVSFSWGTIIALEVISCLEKKGYKVKLVILDGAPELIQEVLSRDIEATTEKELHVSLLCVLLRKFQPAEAVAHNRELFEKCSSSQERLDVFLEAIQDVHKFSTEYKRTIAIAIFARIKECSTYNANCGAITAITKLFKPQSPLYKSALPEDYNLSRICQNLQEIKYFKGNHVSMVNNILLADSINEAFC